MSLKESISTMLNQITAGEKLEAEQTFNHIISQKVAAALENMKVEVAQDHFNVTEATKVTDLGNGTEKHVTKTVVNGIPSTSTIIKRKEGNPIPASDLAAAKSGRMSHGTHHEDVAHSEEEVQEAYFGSGRARKSPAKIKGDWGDFNQGREKSINAKPKTGRLPFPAGQQTGGGVVSSDEVKKV